MTDDCANCRFSQVFESMTFCCFDPPEFIPPNSTALKPVRAEGWCGKHEKVQKRRTTTKAPSSAS
jgi:hypothetical protein